MESFSGAAAITAVAVVEDPEDSEIPYPQKVKKSRMISSLSTEEQEQVYTTLFHYFPEIRN